MNVPSLRTLAAVHIVEGGIPPGGLLPLGLNAVLTTAARWVAGVPVVAAAAVCGDSEGVVYGIRCRPPNHERCWATAARKAARRGAADCLSLILAEMTAERLVAAAAGLAAAAVHGGSAACVALVCDVAGEAPDFPAPRAMVYQAAATGRAALVTYLVRKFDVNIAVYQEELFRIAAARNHVAVLRALVRECGASVALDSAAPPVVLAASQGGIAVLRFFVDECNLRLTGADGEIALAAALQATTPACARFLVRRGGACVGSSKSGSKALWGHAAGRGPAFVRALRPGAKRHKRAVVC